MFENDTTNTGPETSGAPEIDYGSMDLTSAELAEFFPAEPGDELEAPAGDAAEGTETTEMPVEGAEGAETTEAPNTLGLDAWSQAIQLLQEMGATPEMVQQALSGQLQLAPQQPQPAPETPAEAPAEQTFENWLEEQGVDATDLTLAEQISLRKAFEHDQAIQQYAEAQRQAQQQAEAAAVQQQLNAWQGELTQLQAQYPEFKDAELQRDLIARWSEMPEGVTLAQAAEQMRGRWITAYRNSLAQNAVAESQAARQRPPVTGGNPPAPERPDVTKMDDEQFEQAIASELRAMRRAGG